MPLDQSWAFRGQDDGDARFIALAAALRTLNEKQSFDVETMRKHIGDLAQDDMNMIARAMFFAQWIARS